VHERRAAARVADHEHRRADRGAVQARKQDPVEEEAHRVHERDRRHPEQELGEVGAPRERFFSCQARRSIAK
jgi:hypothetical protein